MIKFIVIAKEWNDTKNGNTYFSARIIKTDTGFLTTVRFQYGYDDAYKDAARREMLKAGFITGYTPETVHLYDRQNGYPIQFFISKRCTQKEVREWSCEK